MPRVKAAEAVLAPARRKTARPHAARRNSGVAELSAALRSLPVSHLSLVRELVGELRRRDPDGRLLARSDDLHHIAQIAADRVVDTASVWTEHLGAFYDTNAVMEMLGRHGEKITRQAVSKRKGLLALTTGSGQVVYPTFQFRGQVLAPGLDEVLTQLSEDVVSRWTVASWLRSPEVDLDGQAPIDVLFESGPEGRTAVRNAARAWSAQLGA